MSRATVLKMPLIPPQYNNSQFLHRHFRVFGNIVQVKCSPRMGVATVEFDNHVKLNRCIDDQALQFRGFFKVSAKTAKEQGAVFKPNTEAVKILWGRPLKRGF